MMSWQNFISWLLSVCWEGGRVKETAIVGRDSISFRVVDRLEADPTNDPFTKATTCRILIKKMHVEK
jgi:hypothetical protein